MAKINSRTWMGLVICLFLQANLFSQEKQNTVYSCMNCKVKEYHPMGKYKVLTDGEGFVGLTLFDEQNVPIDQLSFFIIEQLTILNDSTLLTVAPLYGAEIVIRENKLVVKQYVTLTREESDQFVFNQFILYNNNLVGSKFLPKRKGYEFYKTSDLMPIDKNELATISNFPKGLEQKIEQAFLVKLETFDRIPIDYTSNQAKGNLFFAGASNDNLILYHYPTNDLYQFDKAMNLTHTIKMPIKGKKENPYFIYDSVKKNAYFLLGQEIKKKIIYEVYAIDFDNQTCQKQKTINGNIVGVSNNIFYLTKNNKKEDFVFAIPLLANQRKSIPSQSISPIEIKGTKN